MFYKLVFCLDFNLKINFHIQLDTLYKKIKTCKNIWHKIAFLIILRGRLPSSTYICISCSSFTYYRASRARNPNFIFNNSVPQARSFIKSYNQI